MLNLIKVKFGGGEAREFGGEASPPLDETLSVINIPIFQYFPYIFSIFSIKFLQRASYMTHVYWIPPVFSIFENLSVFMVRIQ